MIQWLISCVALFCFGFLIGLIYRADENVRLYLALEELRNKLGEVNKETDKQ